MTGNAPSFATLLLRIFLPFAFAYFLSYIFRGVNAVIFPYLERGLGNRMAAAGGIFNLSGKVALVTGGASGIGESTCRALAAAGASVTITDVDRARADALASELPGASVLMLDITDEPAVRDAFSNVKQLDILVNNAGIGLVGNIEETELVEVGPRLERQSVSHLEGPEHLRAPQIQEPVAKANLLPGVRLVLDGER